MKLVEPMGFEPTTSSMPSRRAPSCATAPPLQKLGPATFPVSPGRAPSCATAPPTELMKFYHKICADDGLAEVGEEGAGAAVERAAAEDYGGDGAFGLRVGDADEAAGFGFVDGHFGDERDAHAGTDHGEKAGEMAAFEDHAGVEASAVAGGDGGIAEAVTVAEKKKWIAAEIGELQCGAAGELVSFRQRGVQALSKKWV